ncbi:MAG: ABC transporter substrate-binding protein [Candidatus Symbiodolus clandestinus]
MRLVKFLKFGQVVLENYGSQRSLLFPGFTFLLLLTAIMIPPLFAAVVPPSTPLAAKQHLVINNGAEIATLDPHTVIGIAEENVLHDLLEGLVSFDTQGQIRPAVATHWHASADNRCWTFYLRPEARWSNGEPLTAQDFVYSWQRLADPQTASPNANYLQELQLLNSAAVIHQQQPPQTLGIRALDNHRLQLQLTQPMPHLPTLLAHPVLYPVHQGTIEHHQGLDQQWATAEHFVGNGAYQINTWVTNEKLTLHRNPTYWDNTNTVIDSVTYLTLSDSTVDLRRYQAGEIDITNTKIPTEYLLKLPAQGSVDLCITPALSVYGYKFNTQRPPFNNRQVRRALTLALDRQALVDINRVAALLGQTVANQLNPPKILNSQPLQPIWTRGTREQRQQQACQWLHAAGYSEQRPLRFSLLYNAAPLHERWAIAVRAQWQNCFGPLVDINLVAEEWRVYLRSCQSGQYQAARVFWTAAYPHPSALLNLFYSANNRSGTFWHNPEFDHWLNQSIQASDETERARCYQQAEQLLVDEVPMMPIFHSDCVRLVKPYVGGFSRQNPMNAIYTKDLYLIQQAQTPSRYRQ